ncbi:MAG: type III-B CRISPR module-associated protein Cmr5 [Phototrophicales bacterium]|nr:MAG: type III-B CRISPR module-associated protein Cmr5 [Phototrophicales bacterium]
MTSKRQSIEQERAASAWQVIEPYIETEKEFQKKYGTLARKLPAMIQMNGLGSTLAFLKSKGKQDNKDAHNVLFNHLSAWVLKRVHATRQNKDLLDFVRNEDVDKYRQATAEAIQYGIWLKRYVEANDWGSAEGDDGD